MLDPDSRESCMEMRLVLDGVRPMSTIYIYLVHVVQRPRLVLARADAAHNFISNIANCLISAILSDASRRGRGQ